MESAADYLRPITRSISEILIGETAKQRIDATAALLPPQFAFSTLGFECRLHEGSPQADFLVSAQKNSSGALRAAPLFRPSAAALPAWRSVNALGLELEGEHGGWMNDIWLEFDLSGAAPMIPNIFLRPIYGSGATEEFMTRAGRLGLLLAGEPLPGAVLRCLRHCVAALPPRACVFQLGVMRARPFSGMRLCINEISLDAILRYLETIGYPGSIQPVAELIIRLQPAIFDMTLGLDLGPEVQPKLGLECYFGPHAKKRKRADAAALLQTLVLTNNCVPAKAEALLAFPGTIRVSGEDRRWPVGMQRAASLLDRHRVSFFERSIHHIKVVYQPGQSLQAKVYLAVRHRWHALS
jgi:hypothetical protein